MSSYKPFLEIIKEMKSGDIADAENTSYASIYCECGYFFVIKPHEEPHTKDNWDLSKEDFVINFKIRE